MPTRRKAPFSLKDKVPVFHRGPPLPDGMITLEEAIAVWRNEAMQSRKNLLEMLEAPRVPPAKEAETWAQNMLSNAKRDFPKAFDEIITALDDLGEAPQRRMAYEALSYLINQLQIISFVIPPVAVHQQVEKAVALRGVRKQRRNNSEAVMRRREKLRPWVDEAVRIDPTAKPSTLVTQLLRKAEFKKAFKESRNTIKSDVEALKKSVNPEQD